MSKAALTGSPTQRRATPALKLGSHEENIRIGKEEDSAANDKEDAPTLRKSVIALKTAKMANQNFPQVTKTYDDSYPMDDLLAKLHEQKAALTESSDTSKTSDMGIGYAMAIDSKSSSSSMPITPATDTFGSTGPISRPASAAVSESQAASEEVLRLKLQLAQAQSKLSRLDQELAHNQPPQQVDHFSSGPASDICFPANPTMDYNVPQHPGPQGPQAYSGGNLARGNQHGWPPLGDDTRSDTSDGLTAPGFGRSRSIWNNNKGNPQNGPDQSGPPMNEGFSGGNWGGRGSNQGYMGVNPSYAAPGVESYRGGRLTPDFDMTLRPQNSRRSNRYEDRPRPTAYGNSYGGYGYGQSQYDSGNAAPGYGQGPAGMNTYGTYQPQPIGTPLSPLASEFNAASTGPWKSEPVVTDGQIFLPTTEPVNYRRLLDRNVNCNWKYIVDKIVCNNDQQASIFLQQKLKVGTPDQKYEIVEAIVAQAFALMVNRFGNFLVQRCFEHGTAEQVVKIAEAIRGHTLQLSKDPFGCHVIQKAFDAVPEDYKAIMVHELLRCIPETVIHRYACHVWQKLFELRWTESPPQIMKYVNEALRGMWHEVALGETGSLVVQNIFENCLEEDKRPCIEEVLANIDIVAHGQFGNWCIQHICEHGAPADRGRAIDHVIRYAAEYSMDQFPSKVVEKCLKTGGSDFLSRYLDRVCEGRVDRPRIPLIDIASDQFGNYLIQWILQNANAQHRDVVAAHIRKHMVSLRGSKFGSRVGMLCTNPQSVTRPGPGAGPSMGPMYQSGPGRRYR